MGAGIRRVYLLTILRFPSGDTSHYICGNGERRIRAKKHLAANTITTATLFFCSVSPLRGIGLGLTYDNHWRQTEMPMITQKMSQVTSPFPWFPPASFQPPPTLCQAFYVPTRFTVRLLSSWFLGHQISAWLLGTCII